MARTRSIMVTALGGLLLAGCASSGGYINRTTPAEIAEANQSSPPEANDKVMYLDLIRKMQSRGLYFASLAHIDAYRGRFGNTPALRLLQAEALRKTRQVDEAERIYRDLRHGPEAAAAWHGLGRIAASRGDYAEATQALSRAVSLAPIDATYLGDLGYARLLGGNPDAAREPLAKAAELEPSSHKAIANLALLLMVEGQPTRAHDMMQKADLPQPTRDAVVRLAAQIRQQARHDTRPATTTTAATRTAAAADNAASVTASAAPTASVRHGISANLLERFQTFRTTTGGQVHEPK